MDPCGGTGGPWSSPEHSNRGVASASELVPSLSAEGARLARAEVMAAPIRMREPGRWSAAHSKLDGQEATNGHRRDRSLDDHRRTVTRLEVEGETKSITTTLGCMNGLWSRAETPPRGKPKTT